MGLRPGRCYSSTKDRPYTRKAHRVQRKDYIGAVPGLKTRQFNMGNGAKEFDTIVNLIAETGKHGIQIRDNAIESARLAVNRSLIENIGKDDFFLKVRIFPHHMLRENKQAQGAGADRVSSGMSHSFGKTIGRAARIKNGQILFSALVSKENIEKAKTALLSASSRVSCEVTTKVSKDVTSIGTKPIKTRDMRKTEEAEEAGKEGEEAKKPDAKGRKDAKATGKAGDKKDDKKPDAKTANAKKK
ncbi:MAG: 50S ribosomal protein L16 [Candidatus Diapherotrites archaeon CG11_big_fil_rev_8_21_14_0_20_37_9]|nr:MAG: 50S ribosomal protein L16 [Candidatus Diapherotrites archaeon CG11_big_fil_rev_8_21_14_0_20_37_9]